jgi:hypothetical protein
MRRFPVYKMLAALVLFPLVGCTNTGQQFGGCGTESDGKILLLWTVRGQPANATGCQGISSLDLILAPDLCNGSVEIEPIPCERDGVGWRYDNLPRGGATIQLIAKDPGGHDILNGSTRVTISSTLPATPTPIDLE